MPEIQELGRLHFLVPSRSRPGLVHLVDLEPAEGRLFWCSCERHTLNHYYHGQRCHHIKAALETTCRS